MSTFRKQSTKTNNAKIDNYFQRSPTKRKTEHDENAPPISASSPSKKRQFGDLKVNNAVLKQRSILLPLRDPCPQKKLVSSFPRDTTEPSFTVLTDDDIKKGITRAHSIVKKKPTVKNIDKVVKKEIESMKEKLPEKEKALKKDMIPEEEREELPKVEMKTETPQEDSEDSDDELFTKTTDSTVKFKTLDLLSFSSDHENSSSEYSDQEDSAVFVDPELEFSLSEISSPPKTPESKTLRKATPKKEATPEDSLAVQQGEYETEDATLASQEPETVSQILIPDPNPRGKDLLEKLGVKKPNKTTEVEADNSYEI